MLTAPTSPPSVLQGHVDALRARLAGYRRGEINRIAVLGGVAVSQIYAFRDGGRGARIYVDTASRIEKGLNAYVAEAGGA